MYIYIIFTDLDGTLLDENYSPGEALELLKKLKNRVPIIFCSGKTKEEQEFFRKKLGINHPFIVEDGSAIYIPGNYFKKKSGTERDEYKVIILGVRVEEILKDIDRLKKNHKIKGFRDLDSAEVARITGLNRKLAELAKKREFSETIVHADKEAIEKLREKYNVVVGGKFLHIFGKNADKGKAVKILKELYRKNFCEDIVSLGIGNSYTDEPMLKEVDIPILVKNPDGKWAETGIKNIYRTRGIGPSGWVEAIKKFIRI